MHFVKSTKVFVEITQALDLLPTKPLDKDIIGQEYAVVPHQPPENSTSISSPWPFAQWGIDLIGPMPKGKGQTKFAIAVVDYFTKWAEAEPLSTIMLVCRESRGLVLRAEGMCVNT
ncbi:unnamed protein product [Prunus armeniaca]